MIVELYLAATIMTKSPEECEPGLWYPVYSFYGEKPLQWVTLNNKYKVELGENDCGPMIPKRREAPIILMLRKDRPAIKPSGYG